jgi:hypothetical protein
MANGKKMMEMEKRRKGIEVDEFFDILCGEE